MPNVVFSLDDTGRPLSHLIREAAIYCILTGAERIDKQVLENVELDHAAVEEAAETQRKTTQKNQTRKKR